MGGEILGHFEGVDLPQDWKGENLTEVLYGGDGMLGKSVMGLMFGSQEEVKVDSQQLVGFKGPYRDISAMLVDGLYPF